MGRERKTADEKDFLDPCSRRFYRRRAGVRKAVKVACSRRLRRAARREIREVAW